MCRRTIVQMVTTSILLSVLPISAVQAFSFCFSFGGKQRSNYYDYPLPRGAYGDYGQYVTAPGMSRRPGAIYPYYGDWYPAPLRQPWPEQAAPLRDSYEKPANRR